jgi:predicted CoA-substrate-specific enzyme activase
MKVKVGVDLGSAAIKAVIVSDGKILWRGLTPTAPGQESRAKAVVARGLSFLGLKESDVMAVAATGYGQNLYSVAGTKVDEIKANAAGLFRLSEGRARVIVNVGGQDLKIIRLNERGRIVDFKMNDKCAAGTGRFFEVAARILDVPLEDFARLSEESKGKATLNSTCVVFAESEIVSLLAKGTPPSDVALALNASVAKRVAALMGQANIPDEVWLDGGPAVNSSLAKALSEEILAEVLTTSDPRFTVAFGAVLSID